MFEFIAICSVVLGYRDVWVSGSVSQWIGLLYLYNSVTKIQKRSYIGYIIITTRHHWTSVGQLTL